MQAPGRGPEEVGDARGSLAPATPVLAGLIGIFTLASTFSIAASEAALALLFVAILRHPRRSAGALASQAPVGWAVLFYFMVQGLSILFSQRPAASLWLLKGDLPVLYLPLFLIALRDDRARHLGRSAFLVAAALAGGLGLLQYATGHDPLGRATLEPYGAGGFLAVGTFGGHLTYGGVMMLGFVASFALLLTARGAARLPLAAVTLLAAGGLLGSHARTAWLGAVAGVAAALALFVAARVRASDARDRWRALVPAVVIVAAGLLALAFAPGLRERFLSIGEIGDDPRVRLWGTALAIFRDFPLFGAGLGTFQILFPLYKLPGTYMATCHPHNDALNTLAHSGLAGALALAGLWGTILARGLSRERTERARLLLVAVVPAFLIAGLGQCYFTDEEPSAILWFLTAIALCDTRGAAQRVGAPRLARRLERRAKDLLLPFACRVFPARAAARRSLADTGRILLVRQDNRLGNLILMTPFLQALRALAPHAHIGMVTGDAFGAILARSPWIDELVIERKRWLIRHPYAYPRQLARIRDGAWDVALELSNADTHSFYNAFLTQVSGAPWRIGFDHPRSRVVLHGAVPPPPGECHYALAPLLLLSALGAEPPIRPMTLPPATLEDARAAVRDAQPLLVVHTGGRRAKRWPAERFVRLLRELHERRREPIVVIGGQGEADVHRTLREALGTTWDIRSLASFDELTRLLAAARLYVGCDAGPLHVAAACNVPTVSLFLTSHPLRYAPLGERHTALLLGERSRAYVAEADAREPDHRGEAPAIPIAPRRAQPDAAGELRWDPAFAARLLALRPRVLAPPCGIAEAAEIEFILDRIDDTLALHEGMAP